MRAFYHAEQALHDPQQFMRFGKVKAAKDSPVRTQILLEALARRGVVVEPPALHGTAPVLAVHTKGLVDFLETAWSRWTIIPDHGPEVWPATFPYWSGRPEEAARPDCPATGFAGQLGWYLGDLSVPMGPDTWASALRSSETAVSAAEAILGGADIAYALCRPSGHHARADRAAGFCYLNNTAIAAQHLRSRGGKVAILDVDAHHGDGTQQIFYNRADVLTVSIHADPSNYYPFYTGYAHEIGHGAGRGFNLNLPLPHGSAVDAMAGALDEATRAIRDFGAETLVVALGYDAHAQDPLGVLTLEVQDFAVIGDRVRSLGLKTLLVQEGGYALDAIDGCFSAFLDGLTGR